MALSGIGFGDQEGQWCPVSMMDGEPGRRVVLGPHRPQASVLQPGAHPSSALKLRSSPARWSPALSCVSFSSQAGPLELTGIALSQMVKPEENLHWASCSWAGVHQSVAQPHDVLKLRSFLVPWSPALNCVSSSAQMGPMALSGIAQCDLALCVEGVGHDEDPPEKARGPGGLQALISGLGGREGQCYPVSMMDDEPGRRLLLGLNRPQASVHQPGVHPLVC
uniref:uncharacterized protein LOC106999086 n=1 Tax=Macaca mulatta TaxID=9544 RepID=UPI0010A2A138|nr:uncharacterized protein LOC106999086 [Macaca mulatta]